MESGCLFYFKLFVCVCVCVWCVCVCVCVYVCACLQEGTDKWQVDGSLPHQQSVIVILKTNMDTGSCSIRSSRFDEPKRITQGCGNSISLVPNQ
jgi:hypothetical protein